MENARRDVCVQNVQPVLQLVTKPMECRAADGKAPSGSCTLLPYHQQVHLNPRWMNAKCEQRQNSHQMENRLLPILPSVCTVLLCAEIQLSVFTEMGMMEISKRDANAAHQDALDTARELRCINSEGNCPGFNCPTAASPSHCKRNKATTNWWWEWDPNPG